jgi:hypothetical protein
MGKEALHLFASAVITESKGRAVAPTECKYLSFLLFLHVLEFVHKSV